MKIVIVVALGFVALWAYARFVTITPKGLDTAMGAQSDVALMGGYTAVRAFSGDPVDLRARIQDIALATPRTTQISDDPLQFVTRSKLMGFPDVTTFQIKDDVLLIHAHLVVGKSDLGVNKARILDWLDRLGPL